MRAEFYVVVTYNPIHFPSVGITHHHLVSYERLLFAVQAQLLWWITFSLWVCLSLFCVCFSVEVNWICSHKHTHCSVASERWCHPVCCSTSALREGRKAGDGCWRGYWYFFISFYKGFSLTVALNIIWDCMRQKYHFVSNVLLSWCNFQEILSVLGVWFMNHAILIIWVWGGLFYVSFLIYALFYQGRFLFELEGSKQHLLPCFVCSLDM